MRKAEGIRQSAIGIGHSALGAEALSATPTMSAANRGVSHLVSDRLISMRFLRGTEDGSASSVSWAQKSTEDRRGPRFHGCGHLGSWWHRSRAVHLRPRHAPNSRGGPSIRLMRIKARSKARRCRLGEPTYLEAHARRRLIASVANPMSPKPPGAGIGVRTHTEFRWAPSLSTREPRHAICPA
jgi:hypothetical protein